MSDLSDTDLQTYGVGSRDFGGMSLDLSSSDAAASTGFDWSSFATAAVKATGDIASSAIKSAASAQGPALPPLQTGGVSVRTQFPQLNFDAPSTVAPAPAQPAPVSAQPKKDRTLLYVAIGAGVGSVALITTAVVLSRRPRRSRGDR